MNTIINPQYTYLSNFISHLPDSFDQEGDSVYKGRNEIKVFDIEGKKVVVKSFKIPNIINKIVYAYFRNSKAKRSYENSLEIMKRGFSTPAPIAYMEEIKRGFFRRSYYVSEFCDYDRSFREFTYYKDSFEGKEDILNAFAGFTAQLQEAGIYHKDYSPGNILFKKDLNTIKFGLVDVNRMKFGLVSQKAGYKNFERICGSDEMLAVIAKRYAHDRGFDENESVEKIRYYNRKVMILPVVK